MTKLLYSSMIPLITLMHDFLWVYEFEFISMINYWCLMIPSRSSNICVYNCLAIAKYVSNFHCSLISFLPVPHSLYMDYLKDNHALTSV